MVGSTLLHRDIKKAHPTGGHQDSSGLNFSDVDILDIKCTESTDLINTDPVVVGMFDIHPVQSKLPLPVPSHPMCR